MPTTYQLRIKKTVVTGSVTVKTEADLVAGPDGQAVVSDSTAPSGMKFQASSSAPVQLNPIILWGL